MPLAVSSVSDWFSMLFPAVEEAIAFKFVPAYGKKDFLSVQEQPQHSRKVEMMNPIMTHVLGRNITMYKITSV